MANSHNYDYDPEAAGHADDNANRIDASGPFIGTFEYAEAVTSSQKGTEGMKLGFDDGHGGKCELTLWTRKADGTPLFGFNFVQAMMTIFGLKGLKAVKGKVYTYDQENNKRRGLEEDGQVFPDLLKKPIGLMLQKELKTSQAGKDFFDMNVWGVFHPTSRLTASEIREKKAKPEKFEKMVKSIRDKDSRKKKEAAGTEPDQPALGAEAGNF